jgi:hypothetical protein
MTRRMHGLALSLENHGDDETKNDVKDVDLSQTAEAKELDSKEDGKKVHDLNADLDNAEESLESIHALVVSLESFNQSGGLDQNGAALLSQLAEVHLNKAGIYGAKVVPSFESFGGTQRKTEATKLSMESLGDMAKDVWAKIIAGLKRLKEWVLKHFFHYFGQAEALLKRAKSLQEQSRKTQGTAEAKTFDDKGLLAAIRVNGVAPTARDVTNFAEFFRGAYPKLINLDPNTDHGEVEGQLTQLATFTAVDGEAGVHLAEDSKAARSERLPGDKALYVVGPKTKPEGETASLRAFSRTELKLAPFDKKAQGEFAGESLPVLATGDVGRVAQSLEGVLAEIVANRKNQAKLGESIDKAIREAEKAQGEESKDDATPEAREKSRATQAAIGNVRNLTIVPLTQITDYALSVSRRLLEYGEKSLRQYKKA